MRIRDLPLVLGTLLLAATPVLAQTTPAPEVKIEVPEGYVVTEMTDVTAEQLRGVRLYDSANRDVGEITDIEIGPEGQVAKIITDVGGFLEMGEHRIGLTPDQVEVYKDSAGAMRAYVTLSKDELKALPTYMPPN